MARRLAALFVALALAAGVAASCGGETSGNEATETATAQVADATTSTATANTPGRPQSPEGESGTEGEGAVLTDQGWSVVPGSIMLEKDFVDDFDGTWRIENGTGAPAAAVFTLKVFKDGTPVGDVRAFTVGSVEPGRVEAVEVISTADYVPGPYTFEFQTDRTIQGRQQPGRDPG